MNYIEIIILFYKRSISIVFIAAYHSLFYIREVIAHWIFGELRHSHSSGSHYIPYKLLYF